MAAASALTVPPSPDHIFGTNNAGNDTFAQAVHGLQRSLVIAVSVSLLTTIISAFVGAVAAYFGGRTERVVLGIVHFLLVVPSFLILALVSQRAGGDWRVLIVVLTGGASATALLLKLDTLLPDAPKAGAAGGPAIPAPSPPPKPGTPQTIARRKRPISAVNSGA